MYNIYGKIIGINIQCIQINDRCINLDENIAGNSVKYDRQPLTVKISCLSRMHGKTNRHMVNHE